MMVMKLKMVCFVYIESGGGKTVFTWHQRMFAADLKYQPEVVFLFFAFLYALRLSDPPTTIATSSAQFLITTIIL